MIIHENGLSQIGEAYWTYVFKIGGNEVYMNFTVKEGVTPKTGDMIIFNQHISKEEGRE